MAMQGETIHLGAPNPCPDCNVTMENEVLANGNDMYYIGTRCDCGPSYSRESKAYWNTRVAALWHLATDDWERR